MSKRTVKVTLDDDCNDAVRAAVDEGRGDSLGTFVNETLTTQPAYEERLLSLGRLVAEYEAGHGEITEHEMAEQERRDAGAACIVPV